MCKTFQYKMRYILFTSKLKPKSSIAYIYIYMYYLYYRALAAIRVKKLMGLKIHTKGTLKI